MRNPASSAVERAAEGLMAVGRPLGRGLNVVAVVSLIVMCLLTVADVSGRYLLNRPLGGALEVSEFLMALLVFFGLGQMVLEGGDVIVDLLIQYFPARVRAALDILAFLTGAAFWGLIAWRTAVQAGALRQSGEVSANLSIPVFPVVVAAAFGSAVLAVVLLARALGVRTRE